VRTFLEPTAIQRVAFIILLGWFIPLTGGLLAMVFSPGGEKHTDAKQRLTTKKTIIADQKQSKKKSSLDRPETKENEQTSEEQEINKAEKRTSAVDYVHNAWSNSSNNDSSNHNSRGNQGQEKTYSVSSANDNTSGSKSNNSNRNPNAAAWNANLNLLARVIHAEARGEPLEGQVAVGAVLLNRLESAKFPNSLWGIIFKKGEFCTVRDGQVWMNPNAQAYKAARMALSGWDPTHGALYFYNPAKTTSKWIWSRPVTTEIGSHLFAR